MKTRQQSHRADRGTSLVEVMIAVAIVAVGLSALSAAIPFAAYGTQEGSQLSTATLLANQRMEQVRRARWHEGPPAVDEIGVSPSPATAPAVGGTVTFPDEPRVAAPFADYGRQVRIVDCGAGGCGAIAKSDFRQVTVTVSYRPLTGIGVGAANTVKTATVTSLLARR